MLQTEFQIIKAGCGRVDMPKTLSIWEASPASKLKVNADASIKGGLEGLRVIFRNDLSMLC